jgi:hypothetical protein
VDLNRLEELLRALPPAPEEWVSKAVETPDFALPIDEPDAHEEHDEEPDAGDDQGFEGLAGPDPDVPWDQDDADSDQPDDADDDPTGLDT